MLLLEDRRFYTYIYLDPRKPGKYSYEGLDRSFLYEPFYVGKGCGRRIMRHLKNSENSNKLKYYKIRKIKKQFDNPIIVKIDINLTQKESFFIEKQYIKIIGRLDLKLGTLTNLTDGGEGATNLSEEKIKQKSNKIKKTLRKNPEILFNRGKKISTTLKNDPSIVQKRKKVLEETRNNNPSLLIEIGNKISNTKLNFSEDKKIEIKNKTLITYSNNPEIRKRQIEKRKETLQNNPEILLKSVLKTKETLKNNPEISINARKKLSQTKLNFSEEKKKSIVEKRKETCITKGITTVGRNNPRYIEIEDTKLIIDLYFDGLPCMSIYKEYKKIYPHTKISCSTTILKRLKKIGLYFLSRHKYEEEKQQILKFIKDNYETRSKYYNFDKND